MTEQPWDSARRNALDRSDRSERRYVLFVILLTAVEVLFLWGFIQLAEFSNRVHVLIFWSTVSTYAVLMVGLTILWGHISRSTRLVLKAIDLSTRKALSETARFFRPRRTKAGSVSLDCRPEDMFAVYRVTLYTKRDDPVVSRR